MQLAEKGKLQLDDKVLGRLKLTAYAGPKAMPDERWKDITIRHCLQHTGGWDRGKSGDPIGKRPVIARAFDITTPVAPEFIVRYMMGQPLDFDPGTKYSYSNLGYLVLGRIIEAVTGEKYERTSRKKCCRRLESKQRSSGEPCWRTAQREK